MFVAVAEEEVDVDVALEVPLPANVEVGRPERIIWELVVVLLAVPDELPATIVLYPKIVVEPTVEVRVVDPVVTIEMTGAVLIAEEETVSVEA